MKISSLIVQLEEIKEKHGDISIMVEDLEECVVDAESAYFFELEDCRYFVISALDKLSWYNATREENRAFLG